MDCSALRYTHPCNVVFSDIYTMALQPLSFKLLWDVATMGSCQWTKTVVLTPTWGIVIIKKPKFLSVWSTAFFVFFWS